MSEPRKPVRTKRTANDKIRGRPGKRSGAELPPAGPAKRASVELSPVKPEKSRLKRYCVRLRGPDYLRDPTTREEIARRFGPGVPVFEMREPVMGRPPVKNEMAVLWITRAGRVEEWEKQERSGQREVVDGKSPLRQVAEIGYSLKWGNSVLAVEQHLRSTLEEMRDRRTERTKRKARYRLVVYDKKARETDT